jgi:Acetyltransferase (GNAT) domain
MVGAALGVDRHPARHRIRYRPVFDTEQPDQEVAGLLVEAAAREGMRSLSLHELPAHGGVQATVAALEAAGFAVHRRERQSECLAVVEGGWAEHRRRFASYDRSVRTKANRLKALWNVTLEEYGPSAGAPVADGFPIYLELYHRSWRQPLSEAYQAYLLELLRGTEALGWPRLYVLLIAGVPAAVHLWSHLGPVATWHSTAYDQRLAATSAGSSIMWWAHERIFAGATPRLLDLMPGHNLLKDRLGPDRAPIVMLEASRRTLVSGVSFPVAHTSRRLGRGVAYRLRARRRAPASRPPAGRGQAGPVQAIAASPGEPGPSVAPLELDPGVRRFLAVAGGHPSPEAMAARWAERDSWWRVGDEPQASVRLGPPHSGRRPVREIVLLPVWRTTTSPKCSPGWPAPSGSRWWPSRRTRRTTPAASPGCTGRWCPGRRGRGTRPGAVAAR